MKVEQFQKRITEAEDSLHDWQRKYSLIANLRLAVMIGALGLTYWIITHSYYIGHVLLGVLVYICFGLCVWWHSKIKSKVDYYKDFIAVNEDYIKRITDEWQQFEDIGKEWIDFDHPYAMDLDIIGEKSLFQKINTTGSWYGRKALVDALLKGFSKEEEITRRQQAVQELIHKIDFCQNVQVSSKKDTFILTEPKRLIMYMKEGGGLEISRALEIGVNILPWINLVFLILAFVTEAFGAVLVTGILMVIMYGSYMIQFGRIQQTLGTMREMANQLDHYTGLIQSIVMEDFSTPLLNEKKSLLGDKIEGALSAMEQLEKLCSASNITLQPLLAIPFNAIWCWDYKVMIKLEKWRKRYGEELEDWLLALGEIESLVSLAVLGQIEEHTTFPLINEQQTILHGKDLGHPLISQKNRVTNEMNLEDEIWVITGSNMSGKTTFLRTIGINLVLAYSGSPVTATSMMTSYYPIYTSMRIKDDLQEGVSTFYAELTRIKMMLEGVKKQKGTLCLIDEIFRGTNSKDRITGAKSVLLGIKEYGGVGAITTHDLELCKLGDREGITNYHFTEYYKEQEIGFDYTLKNGPSTTTNAKYLMEMVGIKIYD